MSEIEKMYENAGIEKVKDYYCPNCETKLEDWFGKHKEYMCPNERCDYALCDDEEDFQECLEHLSYREKYPPFTAEKQINLILCLSKRGIKFNCHSISSGYLLSKSKRKTSMRAGYKANNFPDLLAQHINYIWQDLTEEEKQQVKGILE